MKKLLLSIFFTTTLCSLINASDEIEINESQNSSYVFDFVVKGESDSRVWKKILAATASHLLNFQKKLNRNPLAKKQIPLDETISLMNNVQQLVSMDKNISSSFSHSLIPDPAINPEELEPNTLIIRFSVTMSQCYTDDDDDATIARMSKKILDEFITTLESANRVTFEAIKSYFKKLDTMSHLNEQDENKPIQIGLSLWVKKDNPDEN